MISIIDLLKDNRTLNHLKIEFCTMSITTPFNKMSFTDSLRVNKSLTSLCISNILVRIAITGTDEVKEIVKALKGNKTLLDLNLS